MAREVDLAALRHNSVGAAGGCSLSFDKAARRTLDLSGCEAGQGGTVTVGGPRRGPTCSRYQGRVHCSEANGVSVAVWARRAPAAITLLKATIEHVDEAPPNNGAAWGMWLEPSLKEPKGSLSLAPPRHVAEALIAPCTGGPRAAAMLGSLTVSKRTEKHVAGRGVHIKMIEKPGAVRSFLMAIDGECRNGKVGLLRGAPIEPPPSRVQHFALVIPDYYGAHHPDGCSALLQGLLLEPKLYRGEEHNPLPETMLNKPEGAARGQIPIASAALNSCR